MKIPNTTQHQQCIRVRFMDGILAAPSVLHNQFNCPIYLANARIAAQISSGAFS